MLPVLMKVECDVRELWIVQRQNVRQKCIGDDFLLAVLVYQTDH